MYGIIIKLNVEKMKLINNILYYDSCPYGMYL